MAYIIVTPVAWITAYNVQVQPIVNFVIVLEIILMILLIMNAYVQRSNTVENVWQVVLQATGRILLIISVKSVIATAWFANLWQIAQNAPLAILGSITIVIVIAELYITQLLINVFRAASKAIMKIQPLFLA